MHFWDFGRILNKSSGAVDSLPVPSGWGLSLSPHRLSGFPIPTMLGRCRKRWGLSVPLQGFTWPQMLQAWQDKQETSIPVAWPHPFKGICCICCYTPPHCTPIGIDGWITSTYAKPRVPVSLKVSCVSAPKGLLCTWKQAQFPAAFLLQLLLSHISWAVGDQELWHATWGIVAPTTGFKEEQDKTCALRCDESFIHLLIDMHLANPEVSSGGCVCNPTGLTALESRPGHAVLWRSGGHTSSPLKLKQHSDEKLLAGVILPQAPITTIFPHKPFYLYFVCAGSDTGLFLLLLAIN